MLTRLLFLSTILAALPLFAAESDLGQKPKAGYSESLCIAGVAADDSRRTRDVAGELRDCNHRVREMKALNRVGFAVQLCEGSFSEKPVQLKACYLQTMALNAPSESMANIGMECVQYKDDMAYAACVRLKLATLDQLLKAGTTAVAQRIPRKPLQSASNSNHD